MKFKIYHNPRCQKSRAGLKYLEEKGVDAEVVNYLLDGLCASDVQEILLKSNLKPLQIVRNNEVYFKNYLKGKNFADDEWIKIIVANPKLLQRPFVVAGFRCVLGNPPQNIDKLFNPE